MTLSATPPASELAELVPWLLAQASKRGADAADALGVHSVELSLASRMQRPEGLERSESTAIGLRVWVGEQLAMVSTSDLTRQSLLSLTDQAISMAKAAPHDADATLAPEALLCTHPPDLDLLDATEPSAEALRAQCLAAEASALAVDGITNSEGAQAGYGQQQLHLATCRKGEILFSQGYGSSHHSLSVSVLAGSGTAMERDYEFTSAHHAADLLSPQQVGERAAQLAVRRLGARKVKSCVAPVLFDPRVGKGLLSILAGAISGHAISRGSSFLKDAMGEVLFPAHVQVSDDPHRPRGQGSRPFDGEGVRNARRQLVENGRLTSWLLDMRSANRLKLAPTGHASRGLGSPPSPASTNLYFHGGSGSAADLLRDTGSGFYVTETFGMGVNLTTGDYSQGAAGFWIENGELAYPVAEITIAGKIKDMFAALSLADDLEFRYATNAPTLRVGRMTIAGL